MSTIYQLNISSTFQNKYFPNNMDVWSSDMFSRKANPCKFVYPGRGHRSFLGAVRQDFMCAPKCKQKKRYSSGTVNDLTMNHSGVFSPVGLLHLSSTNGNMSRLGVLPPRRLLAIWPLEPSWPVCMRNTSFEWMGMLGIPTTPFSSTQALARNTHKLAET